MLAEQSMSSWYPTVDGPMCGLLTNEAAICHKEQIGISIGQMRQCIKSVAIHLCMDGLRESRVMKEGPPMGVMSRRHRRQMSHPSTKTLSF
jgi:hypothetical protein